MELALDIFAGPDPPHFINIAGAGPKGYAVQCVQWTPVVRERDRICLFNSH